jgi:hypothetical protein
MLDINTAGDEIHSISCEHLQESFTALIDERDFLEVHDASAFQVRAVVFLPTFPQLVYPGVRESAMQNPSFFPRCFIKIDFQHDVFLRAYPGRIPCRAGQRAMSVAIAFVAILRATILKKIESMTVLISISFLL